MKKIAIVGWSTGQNSFGVSKTYLNFIYSMGAIPLIIYPDADPAYHKTIIEQADILLLPGGPDLSSHLYGEAPHMYASDPCKFREFFFIKGLPQYIGNIPIFGICLGFQMLNVHFGGKLIQDLPTGFHSSDIRGSHTHRAIPVEHFVNTGSGTIRRTRNSSEPMWVNSHHHQAVPVTDVGEGLLVTHVSQRLNEDTKKPLDVGMLLSTENRNEALFSSKYIVEAFSNHDLLIYGVQWHPEEIWDDYSVNVVNYLLEESAQFKQRNA